MAAKTAKTREQELNEPFREIEKRCSDAAGFMLETGRYKHRSPCEDHR